MNKLEVGMYVRTKYGIRKINEIDEDNNYYIDKTYINDFRQKIDCITDNCIIGKPSFNPIDLIEVGDYVNGKYVDEVAFVDGDYFIKTKVSNTTNYDYLPAHLIKSIVTKEQMEAMQYVVK